jgi:hypothetical protein
LFLWTNFSIMSFCLLDCFKQKICFGNWQSTVSGQIQSWEYDTVTRSFLCFRSISYCSQDFLCLILPSTNHF